MTCEVRFTVVIVAAFALTSLLFWSAIFSRLERFGFDVNCVVDPSPEMDIAVDREPWGY